MLDEAVGVVVGVVEVVGTEAWRLGAGDALDWAMLETVVGVVAVVVAVAVDCAEAELVAPVVARGEWEWCEALGLGLGLVADGEWWSSASVVRFGDGRDRSE